MPASFIIRIATTIYAASLVRVSRATDLSLDELVRAHSRDMPVKRATDCGTWVMKCAQAEGACQNACYYVNYVDTSFVATYSSSVSPDHNSAQSGSQTQQGSICNLAPFSQRFNDPQQPVNGIDPEDPGAAFYNCDEFPMAAMMQPDFATLPAGSIRNSLRCIPGPETSSGTAQFTDFINGNGKQPQRTCSGALPDGATFRIAFDYTNADISRLSACKDSSGNLLNANGPDSYNQFYMTKLGSTGVAGSVHFPYQPANDNHYAIGSTGKDVLQCKVVVNRTSGEDYEGQIFDGHGIAQGHTYNLLDTDGSWLMVPGWGGILDLAVIRTGTLGDVNGEGSEVRFNYGAREFGKFQLGTDFFWSTSSQGWDLTLGHSNVDTIDGGYCIVPNIKHYSDSDGQNDRQTITCYFPCNAA